MDWISHLFTLMRRSDFSPPKKEPIRQGWASLIYSLNTNSAMKPGRTFAKKSLPISGKAFLVREESAFLHFPKLEGGMAMPKWGGKIGNEGFANQLGGVQKAILTPLCLPAGFSAA